MAMAVLGVAAQGVTIFTDFGLNTPNTLTDGRDTGYGAAGGGTATNADTIDGWTWYTESSTTNDNLTIPFGGGIETIGEQHIRQGNNEEYANNDFHFGWGGNGTAIALRSSTISLAAGNASVTWVAGNGNLQAYYSQDTGTSWTALTSGATFTAAAGTLEVVFVGNDGNDSNTRLDTVTIVYVPEPSAVALFGLGGLGMFLRRRS